MLEPCLCLWAGKVQQSRASLTALHATKNNDLKADNVTAIFKGARPLEAPEFVLRLPDWLVRYWPCTKAVYWVAAPYLHASECREESEHHCFSIWQPFLVYFVSAGSQSTGASKIAANLGAAIITYRVRTASISSAFAAIWVWMLRIMLPSWACRSPHNRPPVISRRCD